MIDSSRVMNLLALPAFANNGIWMLHDGAAAVVFDPGAAAPVLQALDKPDLRLSGILVTHHHADRVGGAKALRPRLQAPVRARAYRALPGPLLQRKDSDHIEKPGGQFSVLDRPHHTAGQSALGGHHGMRRCAPRRARSAQAGAVMRHRHRPPTPSQASSALRTEPEVVTSALAHGAADHPALSVLSTLRN